MNFATILFSLFILCCVENGYSASNSECAVAVTTLPDVNSGCCGNDVSGTKLIGGNLADLGQYPWLAIIEYLHKKSGQLKLVCGGSLITSKYVLTAAHCLGSMALSTYTPKNVRLGEHNVTNEGIDCITDFSGLKDCTDGAISIPIENYIVHPEFNIKQSSKPNDIALIRMKENAPYTDFIQPICLPDTDVTLQTGQINFIMAGWGTSHGPSDVKLRVYLPFIPQSTCQEIFQGRHITTLSKGQLCAGGKEGEDSCKGDGGMPLMYETGRSMQLAGIVSFGASPCGQKGIPSVYTNIYEYKSWISSNIVA